MSGSGRRTNREAGNKLNMKPMTVLDKAKSQIFFEKQEGRLCGQHCLNNALQSHLFTAVDLSVIAQSLDEEERKTMAERGTNTKEYLEFISKPSSNYDDSGYFSIQVLSQALRNVNLELINWKSEDYRAVRARNNPENERLFICHMEDHWLALRRFGYQGALGQWVDLNSMLKEPELMSDTYLSECLHTLQGQGYTIFVIFGELSPSPADEAFRKLPRNDEGKYVEELADPGYRLGSSTSASTSPVDDEEEQLRRAINLSLEKPKPNAEDIRRQREQFLQRLAKTASAASVESKCQP